MRAANTLRSRSALVRDPRARRERPRSGDAPRETAADLRGDGRRRREPQRPLRECLVGVDFVACVLAGVPERRVDVLLDRRYGLGLPEARRGVPIRARVNCRPRTPGGARSPLISFSPREKAACGSLKLCCTTTYMPIPPRVLSIRWGSITVDATVRRATRGRIARRCQIRSAPRWSVGTRGGSDQVVLEGERSGGGA
jgi:hypothetical protein